MTKIMSILVSVMITLSSLFYTYFGGEYKHDKTVDNNYPCVFVHGFMGFGYGSGANHIVSYWGATACDLIPELNKLGYDCHEADIGAISSNWDRACELYAQLTGSTVDYGEAHAKAHNHLRYGRTYSEPIVENWGGKDENGKTVKVNLIGHSFGGNTIRLFLSLLDKGDSAEIEATKDGSLSELFTGGKSDLVNSITTYATPHNGTTLTYVGEEIGLLNFVEKASYFIAGTAGRTELNQMFDFHLEQFGITPMKGEKARDFLARAIKTMMENYNNDSAYYDLSPDGAKELNDRSEIVDGVYYYSNAFCTTKDDGNGKQVADKGTFLLLYPFCRLMGKYDTNKITDYKIDETWLENDGLVNTVSEKAPFDEPSCDFNYGDDAQSGVWNILPVFKGDHGFAVGLMSSKTEVLDRFTAMMDQINSKG